MSVRFHEYDTKGSWPEDAAHRPGCPELAKADGDIRDLCQCVADNGSYCHTCVVCFQPFIGHKRRVVCKQCEQWRGIIGGVAVMLRKLKWHKKWSKDE